MKTNTITPFDYAGQQVRTVEEHGRILFCGRDVATVLGYANPNDALAKHCKGVAKRYPLETPGGVQQIRFITEGDLYRLIAHSKLETAQQFETWVFDEVLPAIRKHGMYATPSTVEAMLADPDSMIKVLETLKAERARNHQLTAQVEEAKPKVLFADAVTTSKTSILVGEMAKILKSNGVNIGQNRFFTWLRENEYLIKRKGTDWNMPTQRAMEMGLFEIKETVIQHADGHTTINKTPKITGKGQLHFINKFLEKE